MRKNRIEGFSDGVIAIIITIMVLELKLPAGTHFSDLYALHSVLLCYVLSFVYLAIYWNNHHHLFQAVNEVDGRILWANIYLLFWLTFIPFVTSWAGENYFAALPTASYGFILLMSACAYYILTQTLISKESNKPILANAIGKDAKGAISIFCYSIAIPIAFWKPLLAFAIYVFVAMMWFIPERRIERMLK